MGKDEKIDVPHIITNRVFLLDFGERINTEAIIEKFSNIEYNPETFPGIMIAVEGPLKLTIFTTGKMMAVGIKKEEDLKKAIEYAKKIIKKIEGKEVGDPKVKEINMSIHIPDLSKAIGTNYIDLDKLVFYLDNVSYEPDIFPALKYEFRLKDGKVIAVNLFKNAKANITGPNSMEQIEEAKRIFIKKLREALKEIKKENAETKKI